MHLLLGKMWDKSYRDTERETKQSQVILYHWRTYGRVSQVFGGHLYLYFSMVVNVAFSCGDLNCDSTLNSEQRGDKRDEMMRDKDTRSKSLALQSQCKVCVWTTTPISTWYYFRITASDQVLYLSTILKCLYFPWVLPYCATSSFHSTTFWSLIFIAFIW